MNHDDISDDDIAKEYKIILRECKNDKERFDNIANAICGFGFMHDLLMKYMPEGAHNDLNKFLNSLLKNKLKVIKKENI